MRSYDEDETFRRTEFADEHDYDCTCRECRQSIHDNDPENCVCETCEDDREYDRQVKEGLRGPA